MRQQPVEVMHPLLVPGRITPAIVKVGLETPLHFLNNSFVFPLRLIDICASACVQARAIPHIGQKRDARALDVQGYHQVD